jgi:quercetin dioxygenase-like cupin family protein
MITPEANMELLSSMNHGEVAGWRSREVAHRPCQTVTFYFHEVEEWLEVLEGRVTFYTAGGRPFCIDPGQALRIPQGEVHRVEIGPDGVLYRMWLPADIDAASFTRRLDGEEMDLHAGIGKARVSEGRASARPWTATVWHYEWWGTCRSGKRSIRCSGTAYPDRGSRTAKGNS